MLKATLVVVLCSLVRADITGTNPAAGTCLCVDTQGLNVRDGPCGTVIGSTNTGSCYVYTGSKQTCSLSGITYDFFQYHWGSGTGWSAGNYLITAPDSRCSGRSGGFTDACLKCICKKESGCNPNIGCNWDVNSYSCGPYQIKEAYWIDCGSPGSGWVNCATNMDCAEQCVRAYMARYGTYCTDGRTPTCEDYARIHNGGPKGCTCSCTLGYWPEVRDCCGCQTCCD